jgi:hypothetical protein
VRPSKYRKIEISCSAWTRHRGELGASGCHLPMTIAVPSVTMRAKWAKTKHWTQLPENKEDCKLAGGACRDWRRNFELLSTGRLT